MDGRTDWHHVGSTWGDRKMCVSKDGDTGEEMKGHMERQTDRQAARREQPLIAVLLTIWLVNTSLVWNIISHPQVTKTNKGLTSLFKWCMQGSVYSNWFPEVCSQKQNKHTNRLNKLIYSRSVQSTPRVPNNNCNISIEPLRTEVHSFTLLFPYVVLFCDCVSARVCVCSPSCQST